jgi:cellulose biosynthesis protein BcsQ
MPIQTRSITRQLFAKDTSMAPLKIDVLTTPGIASQIAKHFDEKDDTLVSLFLTVNDERFRQELLPYCKTFQNNWNDMLLKMEEERRMMLLKMEEERRTEARKKSLLRTIKEYIQVVERCEGYDYVKIGCIGMYEFICDNMEDIPLLGKKFGTSVGNNLYELIQNMEEDDDEFYSIMSYYEEKLWNYLEWAFDQ